MACVLEGPIEESLSRDAEGYRTYTIKWLVRGTTFTGLAGDGPANALRCPGLPLPGAPWSFGDDFDPWVWCRPDATVEPYGQDEGKPFERWTVEQTFSNKPLPKDQQRCGDTEIEDPLLEPQKVSGSFVKKTEEQRYANAVYHNSERVAFYSDDGLVTGTAAERDDIDTINPIVNSAWEPIRGPTVEFDRMYAQVRIIQNVPNLQLELLAELSRTPLNDAPLWGLPARCVRLSEISWEKRFHGLCSVYYTRTLVFDTDENTFDRTVDDEAQKVLNGHWGTGADEDLITPGTQSEGYGWVLDHIDPDGLIEPDPYNPADFIRATDRLGNPFKLLLNGRGVPFDENNQTIGTADDKPGKVTILFYGEADLLQLGIPTEL